MFYYESVDDSLSNGRSSTPSSHGSPTSARSVSPAPPTSQISASDRESLDREIATVLSDRMSGVYGKRLGKEYERLFKKSAPSDILEYAEKLPFVKVEE